MSKNKVLQPQLFYMVTSLLVLFLLLYFTFPVKKVSCSYEGNNQEELATVCQQLENSFRGKSLLFTNFSDESVWQTILENENYRQIYHLASQKMILPHHLLLTLDARLPDYRLTIVRDTGEKNFLLNQSNRLKSNQPDLKLLNIVYRGETEIAANNKELNADFHDLFLRINQAILSHQLPVKTLTWKNEQLLELDLEQSWTVVLDQESDFERQLEILAVILRDPATLSRIENYRYLDLRFRLPVMRDQL